MPSKEILQQHQLVRVTFELPPEVQGNIVHLVGDFTGWEGVPMKRGDDGGWTTTVDLAPGRSFEFRYLVDGERWENDWDADRYVRSPFGHDNSVVDTPALDAPESAVQHRAAGKAAAQNTAARKQAVKGTATPKAAKETATPKAAKKSAKRSATNLATNLATKTATKTAPKKTAAKKTAPKEAAARKAAPKEAAARKADPKKAAPKTAKPASGGAAGKGVTGQTGSGTKSAGRKAADATGDGSRSERRDDTSEGR
jgi:hypothetical protein